MGFANFRLSVSILYIFSSNQNLYNLVFILASQVALVVKSLLVNAGDIRDRGSILGLGRSPGGGQSNPLQCSCLKNPMDRKVSQATVHRVTKSWT